MIQRTMSFNIRYDNPGDGINDWKHRMNLVFQILRAHEPHSGGLQEVLFHQLVDLQKEFPEYCFLGVGRDNGEKAGEFCPIFYLKERFDSEGWGTFWLSETPEIIGTTGWDAACPRLLTWIKLKDRKTKSTLFLANTHIDHMGQTAMQESGQLILSKLEILAGDLPTILCGDFNNSPGSDLYNLIIGSGNNYRGFSDSRSDAGIHKYGPEFTFHDFKTDVFQNERVSEMKEKQASSDYPELIDYIFIRNRMTSTRHEVITDSFEGNYPSDHMPIIADLNINDIHT